MNSMAIDRRHFLSGVTALTASSAFIPLATALSADVKHDDLFISACRTKNGQFKLLVFTLNGQVKREVPLEGRGHDVAFHQYSGQIVAFARRPGRFALAFNARDTSPIHIFAPPPNRHFFGHGAFSHDGRLLFATENDFAHARGVIGIYDATNDFARVGEIPSHGIGPHEILLLPDNKTLVVANGGIETHPDSGRTKLNILTMKPSMCFVDIKSGDLKTRHQLPPDLHKLSIRHLAADKNGRVWFGAQWQGSLEVAPGLIGSASADTQIKLINSDEPLKAPLKGYIGSVALSRDGRWLAASAPRTGRIIYLDTQNAGKYQESRVPDGCGLAQLKQNAFAISSGHGALHRKPQHANQQQTASFKGIAFDNHMRAIF